jgi:hypothetical protein
MHVLEDIKRLLPALLIHVRRSGNDKSAAAPYFCHKVGGRFVCTQILLYVIGYASFSLSHFSSLMFINIFAVNSRRFK